LLDIDDDNEPILKDFELYDEKTDSCDMEIYFDVSGDEDMSVKVNELTIKLDVLKDANKLLSETNARLAEAVYKQAIDVANINKKIDKLLNK